MAERSGITASEAGRKGGSRVRDLIEKGREALGEVTAARRPDAIRQLVEDHEKVEQLFDQAESAEGAECTRIVKQIIRELTLHTKLEEDIFYPSLRDSGDDRMQDMVAESIEEHHVVTILMDELKDLSPDDEAFSAKLEVLQENVEHHVEEEESDMFPRVEKLFDSAQFDDLARRMHARRRELKQQIQ